MTVNLELETQKNFSWWEKGMVQRNIDPLLSSCPVLVDFLWFLIHCILNLFTSLFPCAKAEFGCYSFLVQNWKIPAWNGNLLLRFEELNNKIILSLPTVLIHRLVLIICCDSKVVCQFISPLVPLRPLVGLRPSSNSLILSFHLTITLHLCLLLFRTQLQKACSLYAVTLSFWH